MNRFNALVPVYLKYSSPAVLILLIFGFISFHFKGLIPAGPVFDVIWEILAFHFMFWIIVFIYFLFLLLLSASARNRILPGLARMRERDEREAMITGLAARYSMLATLALLLLLLFISSIEISVTKLPPEMVVDGKKHELRVGLSFRLTERNSPGKAEQRGNPIFTTEKSAISSQAAILAAIIWQLASFKYIYRRLSRR